MQEKKRKKSEKLFLSYWKLTEHVSNLSRQDGQAVTLFYISYTSDTNNKKICVVHLGLLGAVCRLSRQDKYVNVQMCIVKSPVAAFAVKISIYRKIWHGNKDPFRHPLSNFSLDGNNFLSQSYFVTVLYSTILSFSLLKPDCHFFYVLNMFEYLGIGNYIM